jgi:ArsR family transcriptional regulator
MDIEQTSARLKALGHPTRLRIIHFLREEGCCVSELEKKLELRQSNVSQHLRILRDMDLVQVRREGQTVCYSLNETTVEDLLHSLADQEPETQPAEIEGDRA